MVSLLFMGEGYVVPRNPGSQHISFQNVFFTSLNCSMSANIECVLSYCVKEAVNNELEDVIAVYD